MVNLGGEKHSSRESAAGLLLFGLYRRQTRVTSVNSAVAKRITKMPSKPHFPVNESRYQPA
ncbi:hypothetical protein RMSM_07210 [Rhodopirellula maiorica SM1]|uniref:Uncharacterized protein n=1 Tax=Rhodopirellula maiorica SM1 TaxID=1265738 RepID=M5RKH5_9BACT|nr:hypothetical protein RMSM_07210 [Rhodopirellula maiorica SM1]